MYIPKINLTTNTNEIVAFMQQFSFATIVTAKDGFPTATHLPFVVTAKEEHITLVSHFARANEQWAEVENCQVLVIFSEPHAYISPTNYEKELNVPTWNYVAVHAYGQGKLITDTKRTFEILESTIETYEKSYREQWEHLPEEYKIKMAKGIVAFEVLITDLQAKKKLSQNRTEIEKQKIIETLSESKDTNEQLIATYMQRNEVTGKIN